MTISFEKKKILAPGIAIILLIILMTVVFSALTFMRDGLMGAIGDIGGLDSGGVHFNFQRANDLGIAPE